VETGFCQKSRSLKAAYAGMVESPYRGIVSMRRHQYLYCAAERGRSWNGVSEGNSQSRVAPMPSLIRLIFALGLLGGLAYGAIFSLATFGEPKTREITVTVPQDHLNKHR
jgi:hypothetical protein